MKTKLSPCILAIAAISLLCPNAHAGSGKSPGTSKSRSAETAAATPNFHLPTPPTAGKPETGGERKLLPNPVRKPVKAQRFEEYRIEPDSLANGIVALSQAYRQMSANGR
jgi:hypothetical protein